MAKSWPWYGQVMAMAWPRHGQVMAKSWQSHGHHGTCRTSQNPRDTLGQFWTPRNHYNLAPLKPIKIIRKGMAPGHRFQDFLGHLKLFTTLNRHNTTTNLLVEGGEARFKTGLMGRTAAI